MSVLIAALALTAQQSVTLKYQPKVGSTIRYKVVQTMNMGPMGDQNINMVTSQKVDSVSGGVYTVTQRIEQANLGGNDPRAKKAAEDMKKEVSTLLIDSSGTITVKPGSGKSGAMMRNMSGSGIAFPKKALKVGDTWSQTTDMGKMLGSQLPGMSSSGKLNLTYKIAGINATTVNVTFQGTGAMGAKGGAGAQAKNMQFNMDMLMSGSYQFDRATGVLLSSTLRNTMNIGSAGQTMQMKQNMSMTKI